MKYFIWSFLAHSVTWMCVFFLTVIESPKEAQNSFIFVDFLPLEIGAKGGELEQTSTSPSLLRSQKRVVDSVDHESRVGSVQVSREGSVSSQALDEGLRQSYIHQLKNFIDRRKYYPPLALKLKQSGQVKIRLRIAKNGEFKKVQIASPCPHATLNQAALSLIRGLKKFKPLPSHFQLGDEFIIPMTYQL